MLSRLSMSRAAVDQLNTPSASSSSSSSLYLASSPLMKHIRRNNLADDGARLKPWKAQQACSSSTHGLLSKTKDLRCLLRCVRTN
mmetsp:Transcript_7911/g.15718  ORF Transcript_7911/g.15718 Transcript_7911/m.15718 type:complete len:85 (-) Transcript_7911:669-923(-)